MYTGIRLSNLALGEPLLNQNYEYNGKTGKDAITERLHDQFFKIYNLGIKYVIDTIIIQNNNSILSLYPGIGGDIWTLDERLQLYQKYAEQYNISIVVEIDISNITASNVNQYCNTILYDIILQYSWVRYWIIGVQPDSIINNQYKCAPELYTYILQQIYPKIKMFNSNILIGGPNIHQSIKQYIINKTGWLSIACGDLYNQDYTYNNLGKNGILDYIDIFAILGKQDSQYCPYNEYANIVDNIRELLYSKLSTNNILIFATNQGHTVALNDIDIYNSIINSITNTDIIENMNNMQLNQYTQNLFNAAKTTELNRQAYNDIKEICNALRSGVISFKRELLDSNTSKYGIYTSPSSVAIAKSSTYPFIFDILKNYTTIVRDSSIYESNDNIESITLQQETDNIINRATIIWPVSEQPVHIILQATSNIRQYYINNVTKKNVDYTYTTELTITYDQLLVVYEQVNQFVFDEADIKLNISRRLRYQREIHDQMMKELPSSYNSDTTDTNIYRIMRAFATELADASMRLTMLKEDISLDTAREEALYHNFGSLIRLQKQSTWSYEKYRKLIKGILSSLFRGPTTNSVATALQLFTEFKVSINELYKEKAQKKYADLLRHYNPDFTFIIEVEKPLDNSTYTQKELIEDNAYILQLTKPAHTIGIIIIILVGSEDWYTFYKDKYNTDWNTSDETKIHADFSKKINENTYGWKAIDYPGTFTISPTDNGIYKNSLLNGSAIIGPQYTLLDTSHLSNTASLTDLYNNTKIKEQLIYSIGLDAIEEYNNYTSQLCAISTELNEPRFGFIDNKYMQLSGDNITDKVLNKYLAFGNQSKLKDELLVYQQQFFSDKFLFSSTTNAIKFTTPDGISSQFAALNNIITEWQNYLKEHSFKEKLINGQIIERISDNINLYLEGYKEKFKNIYEQHKLAVNLQDNVDVTDDITLPIKLNEQYSNHKFLKRKREKLLYNPSYNDLYNIPDEIYPYELYWDRMNSEYFNPVQDYHLHNNINSYISDKFYLKYHQNQIRFNQSNGYLYTQFEKFNLSYTYNDKYIFIPDDTLGLNIINSYQDNYNFIITDTMPALHNELYDQFGLKYNQNRLCFNKLNGKLISYNIEKFNLHYWQKDKYTFNKDEISLINAYNTHKDDYKFTIIEEIPILHTELTDQFGLKYHQDYLRFNNSNGKLINYHIEKFNLHYWYNDKYIFDKDEISLINIYNVYNDNYNFAITEEIPILHTELTDQFGLKYHQAKLQLNKDNKRFISNNIEKFNLHYYFNDIFDNSHIHGLLTYHIDFKPKEIYDFSVKETNTLSTLLFDRYQLKYQQNYLKLNKSNNKFISYLIEKYDLYTSAFDNYNFIIKDDLLANINYFNQEKYFHVKDKLYNVYHDSNNKEQYQLKYQQNYLKLNKSNNKFINYLVDKYNINTYLIDQYNFSINDNFNINLNFINTDKYTVKNELYNVYNNFNDQYQLKYQQNYLKLNKSNNKFISYLVDKYNINTYLIDQYNFPINDNFNINLNFINTDKYTIKNELYNVYNNFNDQYQLKYQQNYLKLNKSNNKFISYLVDKYNINTYLIDKYNFSINDSFNTYLYTTNIEDEYTVENELYSVYNDFDDQYQLKYQQNYLKLNKNNNKFISYLVDKYNINTYLIDQYKFSINDSFNTYLYTANIEDKYTIKNELYSVYNNFNDQYQLKYQQNYLKLNKNNNKFISYLVDKYSFNTYLIDKYKFSINDSFNTYLYTANIEDEYTVKNELYSVYNNFDDQYQLKYQQNYLKLNKSNNKFISYLVDKYNINTYLIDKYNFSINDSFNTYLYTANIEDKYTVKNELYNVYNNFEDQYYIFDEDDNNYLKFITKIYNIDINNNNIHTNEINTNNLRLSLFKLYGILKFNSISPTLIYRDKYNCFIDDTIFYNINSFNKELYKIKNELYLINNNFQDQYSIYDEDNALILNKHNGVFISKYAIKYYLNPIYNDKYNSNIKNEYLTYYNNSEYELYKVKNELYSINNNFQDKYSIYDEDNALILNKHNGVFISKYAIKYYLNPIYNDKYNSNIKNEYLTHYNNSEYELYNIKNTKYEWNPDLTDKYSIYDEDNALILNKHNGIFISKYATKYHFNPIYNDKYIGLKNCIPTFTTNTLSEDQYYTKNDNIAELHPNYSEHYILDENIYRFNKFNGRLMSIPVTKYMFNYRYKEKDIFHIKENYFNHLQYFNKDQIIKNILDKSSINITSSYNQIYDKAYDNFLIHYYKNNYDKFNKINEINFKHIFSYYKEQVKDIVENLFININATYNQIYDKATEWNLTHYYNNNNDIFNPIQEDNYYNHLYSYYNEQISNIIDNSHIHYKYTYYQIYNKVKEFSIPNFISFDKYKLVNEINNIYNQSSYNEIFNTPKSKINLIQSDNTDEYFNLNIDIRNPLQFNKMQLNKCKFITTSNETCDINLLPETDNFNLPQELNITDIYNTEIIENPEENIEVNCGFKEDSIYNNDIHPFQFNLSQFNQHKFTYNNIIEDISCNIINTEYMIKPILILNHINIQYKEYIKKAQSKITINTDMAYNETYKKYITSYISEIVKNEYEKKYEIASSVAYMQAEKRINNQYIIIKKNSYV